MGNIKPTYIKSVAEQLLREIPDEFGHDWEENKIKITENTNIKSKGVRNRVAGYITRKKRREEC
jgi:small subunit ribosomal protein S17e